MSIFENGLELDTLTTLDWVGLHLALGTGIIHLVVGIRFLPQPVPIMLTLSGLGFFGAIVLLLVGYRRRTLYLAGIPYTLANIVAWYLITRPSSIIGLRTAELLDKILQLLLVGVLVLLYFWER